MTPTIPLGELVTIRGGGTPSRGKKEFWDGPIPWATVKDFKTTSLNSTLESITQEGVKNSATNIVPAGSIVVPTRMAVGKAAINTIEIAINQDLKALLPKREIDTRFLLHFLLSKSDFLEGQAQGATVKGIKLDLLKSLPFPELSLNEQQRIAAILDKADLIRRNRQNIVELTEEFLRSTFLAKFGDPVFNPKGWPMAKLGAVGDLDRGKSRHRPRNDPRLLGGPYPFIQTGDVARATRYIQDYGNTYSELGLSQSKLWPKGTLCITIAANIADTAVLTFDACFPDSVVGFKPGQDIGTEYVQQWFGFLKSIIETKAPKSAQRNINLAILRDLDIPLPPKDEQDQFKELVEKTSVFSERLRKDLKEAEELFDSLSQRAFRGEL